MYENTDRISPEISITQTPEYQAGYDHAVLDLMERYNMTREERLKASYDRLLAAGRITQEQYGILVSKL